MKKPILIHPFLFAVLPVFRLFSANMDVCPLRVTIVPVIVLVGIAFMLWLVLTFLMKNRERAALLVSFLMLLSLSFLSIVVVVDWVIGRHDCHFIALAIWGVSLLLLAYCVVRMRDPNKLTRIFNATSVFLLAISVVPIAVKCVRQKGILPAAQGIGDMQLPEPGRDVAKAPPNVYYIILDGYARDDILREMYEYDNTEFIDSLRRKGFYVARRSTCNYPQTALSLASSLNFQYLDELAQVVGSNCDSRLPLTRMVRDSRIARLLRRRGYTFITFSMGVPHVEIPNADRYISTGHLGEFSNWLIDMSFLPELPGVRQLQYDIHRKSILNILNEIPRTCELKPPVFVLAHILAPHPPFVFGPEGEKKVPAGLFRFGDANHLVGGNGSLRGEYRRGYRDQLAFISRKVEATIDAILAGSPDPPVIILQGDHGPGSILNWEEPNNISVRERTAILNAYYLPDGGDKWLYDDITPVNTFRLISTQYLGSHLELLTDRCYFATWSKPYAFSDVTTETHP